MEQSILTPWGEMFISDLIEEVRDGPDDYFMSNLCDDWGLEYDMGTVHIPTTYQKYGRIVKRDSPPLLLKTLIGYPTGNKIRKAARDQYPYFHHELYGEICIWEEALRHGSPHTELFAPIYHYDDTDYSWAVVGRATNILHRGTRSAKQLEERAGELGWAADDTEVGTFEGRTVAVDYGGWWRHDNEWATGIDDRPYHGYYDGRTNTHGKLNQAASAEDAERPARSISVRLRQWLSSRFS